MSFINEIKQRAKEQIKTIVLPESNDIRVLKAVDTIVKEKFANIILIGNLPSFFSPLPKLCRCGKQKITGRVECCLDGILHHADDKSDTDDLHGNIAGDAKQGAGKRN